MGGANCSLFDLTTEMKKRGYRVCVVVLYRGCPIDIRLREAGIETFPCFFGWWVQPREWNVLLKIAFRFLHWMQWLSVIRISNYIRKNNYKIIHSNSSVIDIGAQVAEKTGCKHVWHFREFGELDYKLHFMMGRDNALSYINKNSDHVIFISKALETLYSKISNKTIIYNGVRDDVFYDDVKSGDCSGFGFLISGNLSDGKNQMLVLEAAKIITDTKRGYSFGIYVAGAATALKESRRYEKALRKYVSDNRMTNVTFLGFVNDMKELRKTKVNAEIVASRCEAYGRVTIEAMASRNIVLASDSGSNPELIGNNEHGILFKDNDASDLAEKMMWCMDNPDRIKGIESNAYEYAYGNHRMVCNIESVEKIYRSL